jgi:hypothetical protein
MYLGFAAPNLSVGAASPPVSGASSMTSFLPRRTLVVVSLIGISWLHPAFGAVAPAADERAAACPAAGATDAARLAREPTTVLVDMRRPDEFAARHVGGH